MTCIIELGSWRYVYFLFFFFQAEDGIRDADVTGVQTCALPISWWWPAFWPWPLWALPVWFNSFSGLPGRPGRGSYPIFRFKAPGKRGQTRKTNGVHYFCNITLLKTQQISGFLHSVVHHNLLG